MALAQKSTINWMQIKRDWAEYFEKEAPENWREIFLPLIQGTMAEQAEALNVEFGMSFNVHNWLGEVFAGTTERAQWWNHYADVFGADIAKTTNEQLGKLISQALNNGWTIGEATKQIQAEFERYVTEGYEARDLTDEELAWFEERLPKYRAELIARTESIKAANAGSDQLYGAWGVTQHEWLSTSDPRTRPSHIRADGQVKPINEPFEVGDSRLMFPGDGSLGADVAEIANCRCTVLPVIEESENA